MHVQITTKHAYFPAIGWSLKVKGCGLIAGTGPYSHQGKAKDLLLKPASTMREVVKAGYLL
jgi:hypothetical protein